MPTAGFWESEVVLAHGGTAGLALELGVLLVPLLCILILLLWGRRHAGPGGNRTSGDTGRRTGERDPAPPGARRSCRAG